VTCENNDRATMIVLFQHMPEHLIIPTTIIIVVLAIKETWSGAARSDSFLCTVRNFTPRKPTDPDRSLPDALPLHDAHDAQILRQLEHRPTDLRRQLRPASKRKMRSVICLGTDSIVRSVPRSAGATLPRPPPRAGCCTVCCGCAGYPKGGRNA